VSSDPGQVHSPGAVLSEERHTGDGWLARPSKVRDQRWEGMLRILRMSSSQVRLLPGKIPARHKWVDQHPGVMMKKISSFAAYARKPRTL
jgi:hypothetical protein